MLTDLTVSSVQLVVPAMQPTWLRLVVQVQVEEVEGQKTYEWTDAVFRVLAYGTLKAGESVYLLDSPELAGVRWCCFEVFDGDRYDLSYSIPHYGEEPPAAGPDAPLPATCRDITLELRTNEPLPYAEWFPLDVLHFAGSTIHK